MKRGETVREAAQVKIRIRKPLRAALEKSAKESGVSLNAEIIRRLEESLQVASFKQYIKKLTNAWEETIARYRAMVEESAEHARDARTMLGFWSEIIREAGPEVRSQLNAAAGRMTETLQKKAQDHLAEKAKRKAERQERGSK